MHCHRMLLVIAFLPIWALSVFAGVDDEARLAATPTKRDEGSGPQADPERREAVRQTFINNYANYEKYAFGFDVLDVAHKNGSYDGAVRGFAGTIIDALDTMIIMGMGESEQYERGLEVIKNLTFDHSNFTSPDDDPAGVVKVFEWTIRLIGGLLAAYQRNGEKPEERFLVDKAQHIADKLSIAWVGKNKIPFGKVNINNNTVYHDPDTPRYVVVAEPGTLVIEWGMLSNYTGNKKYRDLTEGAMEAIIASKPVFPGIWDEGIYPDNNTAALNRVTLGGGYDSFFEYLNKYPVLIGSDRDHPYIHAWVQGLQSIREKLSRKTSVNNFTFLSDIDTKKSQAKFVFSHLACFIGGNIAYGGRLLDSDDWTRYGLGLAESCGNVHLQTLSKVAPFAWGYADTTGNFTGYDYVSEARRSFYKDHGLFVSYASGGQGPEILESIFYAYRITGDKRWQDMAWDIYQNMKKSCDTGNGWAGLQNTNDPSTDIEDQQGTYFYAEVLKYMFLVFDDPEHISLDKHVFNTEAHVFNRPKGPWGTVQGSFKYDFIVGKMAEDSKLPTPTPTTPRPQQYFEAQPGDGRTQTAKAIASQLNIDLGPAKAMFSPLPTANKRKM